MKTMTAATHTKLMVSVSRPSMGRCSAWRYGAHVFHTSNKRVWDYMNEFAAFNHFVNSPLADYHGERYHLQIGRAHV